MISAEIYGYVRDQVYFDFLEKEGINMEFPYKEGQVIEFYRGLGRCDHVGVEYIYRDVFTAGGFYPCETDLRWKTLRVGRSSPEPRQRSLSVPR